MNTSVVFANVDFDNVTTGELKEETFIVAEHYIEKWIAELFSVEIEKVKQYPQNKIEPKTEYYFQQSSANHKTISYDLYKKCEGYLKTWTFIGKINSVQFSEKSALKTASLMSKDETLSQQLAKTDGLLKMSIEKSDYASLLEICGTNEDLRNALFKIFVACDFSIVFQEPAFKQQIVKALESESLESILSERNLGSVFSSKFSFTGKQMITKLKQLVSADNIKILSSIKPDQTKEYNIDDFIKVISSGLPPSRNLHFLASIEANKKNCDNSDDAKHQFILSKIEERKERIKESFDTVSIQKLLQQKRESLNKVSEIVITEDPDKFKQN